MLTYSPPAITAMFPTAAQPGSIRECDRLRLELHEPVDASKMSTALPLYLAMAV